MIMSCLVFPMNCSPGVLRIEISYLAILTGILSSILFYLIFFNLFDSIVLTFKMLLTYMFNSIIFFFYWKKPLRTIISPILMAGVSFELSCLKISQKLEKKMNRKRSSIFLVIKQFSSTIHRLYHQFWWQVFQFELFCLKSYQELEKKSSEMLFNLSRN